MLQQKYPVVQLKSDIGHWASNGDNTRHKSGEDKIEHPDRLQREIFLKPESWIPLVGKFTKKNQHLAVRIPLFVIAKLWYLFS